MAERRRYWLMKTEPSVFSLRDLRERPGRKENWDGVRNYQARNYMRDGMRAGDQVLFYHSSADRIGVAGVAEISGAARPDPTALDPASPYHDPKAAAKGNPWVMVEVSFVEEFPGVVDLDTLRSTPGLEDMWVIRRGMRLSIQPVTPEEFRLVVKLGRKPGARGGSGGAGKRQKP